MKKTDHAVGENRAGTWGASSDGVTVERAQAGRSLLVVGCRCRVPGPLILEAHVWEDGGNCLRHGTLKILITCARG